MNDWYNPTGRPLSSSGWLQDHHRAKLKERTIFATRVIERRPLCIVDLGCGPGLWLEVLNELAPRYCEFVGIDNDPSAIQEAQIRSANWARKVRFICTDFERNAHELPEADTYLAFNIFSYLSSPLGVLQHIKSKLLPQGTLVVRQYDGGLLRFGPMEQSWRSYIDMSLQTSVAGSAEFHHYALDELFSLLSSSSFEKQDLSFEVFQRMSPYPAEFLDYLNNTIEWMARHSSDDVAEKLNIWRQTRLFNSDLPSYFVEVDLVGWLS